MRPIGPTRGGSHCHALLSHCHCPRHCVPAGCAGHDHGLLRSPRFTARSPGRARPTFDGRPPSDLPCYPYPGGPSRSVIVARIITAAETQGSPSLTGAAWFYGAGRPDAHPRRSREATAGLFAPAGCCGRSRNVGPSRRIDVHQPRRIGQHHRAACRPRRPGCGLRRAADRSAAENSSWLGHEQVQIDLPKIHGLMVGDRIDQVDGEASPNIVGAT
jgi:hypothetical protein